MGFRYRKSINLGGGFRINISKSGIGYSWGVKGYRVIKSEKVPLAELHLFPERAFRMSMKPGRKSTAALFHHTRPHLIHPSLPITMTHKT